MDTKRINLALQGGGAHGAFTWGVLDRLLDEDWLEFAAITGTSAGALNGAALKAGLVVGGREGARAALRALWERVAGVGDLSAVGWFRPFMASAPFVTRLSEAIMPLSPLNLMSQVISPYDWGPLWRNPLAPVVEALSLDEVCADKGPKLFVAATNVHSGKVRVFSGDEVTHDAILASACLPTVFRAVEIDGEAYWDGGYSGNPSLHPLYDPALPDDVLIVSINPMYRPNTPNSAPEILNRINEISFNSALLRDLRAVAFVKRLIAEGTITRGAMKDVLVHFVADDDLMRRLSVRSKSTPTPLLIDTLFNAGRAAATGFLEAHADDIGIRGSVDLAEMFG
ncbi:patatin-like phospholipase family protein [Pararhodobacter sp.]|uniref:patatin-like phospholipase family protein n=1 Tax=Pararhodobacter sp. TaxID=2127056 RepID=UPI002AFE4B7D|nr:patatin-like phospholipase family protein [Pararhodobacter sp.]